MKLLTIGNISYDGCLLHFRGDGGCGCLHLYQGSRWAIFCSSECVVDDVEVPWLWLWLIPLLTHTKDHQGDTQSDAVVAKVFGCCHRWCCWWWILCILLTVMSVVHGHVLGFLRRPLPVLSHRQTNNQDQILAPKRMTPKQLHKPQRLDMTIAHSVEIQWEGR